MASDFESARNPNSKSKRAKSGIALWSPDERPRERLLTRALFDRAYALYKQYQDK